MAKGGAKALDQLLLVGQRLSNVAFNVAQRSTPVSISEDERQTLDRLRRQWDEKRIAWARTTKRTKKPEVTRG